MRTVMVLGSEGFVGKGLCRHLRSQGDLVLPVDIRDPSLKIDLRTAKLSFSEVDFVYFLAWDVGGAKWLYDDGTQHDQMYNNLAIMANVFPQLASAKVPFLFVSSRLSEQKTTVYGAQKTLGEIWASMLGGVSVRLWNVYGDMEPSTKRSHVVSDFVSQAVQTGFIKMLTDGTERRQFVHIDDVARAFKIAATLRTSDIVWDVTSMEWVPVITIARMIADITKTEVIPGTRRADHSISACYAKLDGWHPSVTLKRGIENMVLEAQRMKGTP